MVPPMIVKMECIAELRDPSAVNVVPAPNDFAVEGIFCPASLAAEKYCCLMILPNGPLVPRFRQDDDCFHARCRGDYWWNGGDERNSHAGIC